MAAGARFSGWEITVLGHVANHVRFDDGVLTQRLQILQDGKPLLMEQLRLLGEDSAFAQGAAGLRGQPVYGVFVCGPFDNTTLLDFADTGIIDIFVDEAMVKYREQQLGKGGLLPGGDLSSTFSFLRPNDLVWNYVVGNYLKGETPPPFDLLYWNSDSTNLPGPFYAWYLRNTYLENNLVKPGKLTVCGQKVDLRKVDIPVYVYGSREDHIVPIGASYASTQWLPGPKRFVMGASGHIAGVINPPAKNKRSHWIRKDGKLPRTQAEWLGGAAEHAGSWWTDWSHWLKGHAGKLVPAPKTYAKAAGKKLEPAPGRYVKAKA